MTDRPELNDVRPGAAWVAGVPAVALAGLAAVLLFDANRELFHRINDWGRGGSDLTWAWITALGDGQLAAMVVLPFLGRRPRIVWAAVIAAILSGIGSHAIKRGFPTLRPGGVLDEEAFHRIGRLLRKRAFPSGHTTTAFTTAGVIALGLRSPLWRLVALAVACLVGLSRVVVGAHWPGDVLAGAALGWLCAWGGHALARRWTWGLGPRVQQVLGALVAISGCAFLFQAHDLEGVAPLAWLVVGAGLIGGATGWLVLRRGLATGHAQGEGP